MVLLSRHALPDRDRWADHLHSHPATDANSRRIRAVQQLEEKGGKVLVLAADVSNVEDMRIAQRMARDAFGDIHGVIHAAGVIKDAPILGKSLSDIEAVFTPKIHGTEVLDQLFPDGSLDWLAVFASSSTVTAPAGQVDYVAANAFLNAWAQSRSGGKTRVLSLNWGVWAEVGMAAEAMEARRHPTAALPGRPSGQALLGDMRDDANGTRQFQRSLSVKDWVMDEHRTKAGDILLPGTGYLELIDEALKAQGETGPYEVRDLLFLAPLAVQEDGTTDMRLNLPRSDLGYDVMVESATGGTPGSAASGFGPNAEAAISLRALTRPAPLDLDRLRRRCGQARRGDGPLVAPQEKHLSFGPRWKVLHSTAFWRW